MNEAPTTSAPPDFPSLAFFERVVDKLQQERAFKEGTEFFDGSVLIEIGDFSLWMKWYRGRVIDIHEGPDILGSTFALRAPLETWRGIWDLPRISYQPWARLFNFGEIATGGNILEATRVLEATFALVTMMNAEGGR